MGGSGQAETCWLRYPTSREHSDVPTPTHMVHRTRDCRSSCLCTPGEAIGQAAAAAAERAAGAKDAAAHAASDLT